MHPRRVQGGVVRSQVERCVGVCVRVGSTELSCCVVCGPPCRGAPRAAAAPDPSVDRSAEKVPGTVCEKTCPGVKLEGGVSTPKCAPGACHPPVSVLAVRASCGIRRCGRGKSREAHARAVVPRAQRVVFKALPLFVKCPRGVHCFDPQSWGHTSPPSQHPSMAHTWDWRVKEV